jgi:hypothetical protein
MIYARLIGIKRDHNTVTFSFEEKLNSSRSFWLEINTSRNRIKIGCRTELGEDFMDILALNEAINLAIENEGLKYLKEQNERNSRTA